MITLAITTYNRDSMVIEAFEKVLDDPRITEIVIVDDCSDQGFYVSLKLKLDRINNPKIKLYRNEKNLDCYRNKREAVSKASNEWVILLDSDNIIDVTYVDALSFVRWDKKAIYTPVFARPEFNFSNLSNLVISKSNVAEILKKHSNAETMLNACNYFVNRDEYVRVFDDLTDPVTSDTIWMAYNWLKEGNEIFVHRQMQYEHRIHKGSHYQINNKRTPKGFHQEVLNKLKALK